MEYKTSHNMKRLVLATFLSFICLGQAFCNDFKHKEFESSEGKVLRYRVLTPEGFKESEKYPLVLFLHGAGERGSDNESQLMHGGQMFLNPVNREKHPAFVLFPQCPVEDYWAFLGRPASFTKLEAEEEVTPILQAVKELMDSYLECPYIDKSRVYIMGLSMGGMGTFDLVTRYPETFAAAIPICGAADTGKLGTIEGVSFRIYHGDADTVVPVECSRLAYRALRDAGADVEYYEFPGCGHGSWNPAFSMPDFMEWLFKQKKARKYLK